MGLNKEQAGFHQVIVVSPDKRQDASAEGQAERRDAEPMPREADEVEEAA